MAVDYATIVDGEVTAVTLDAGSLPTSTSTTYYHPLLAGDPVPSVGDYFSDVCGTFSSLPRTIPAGDIAPPYPIGGVPPVPGSINYPLSDDPDSPLPLATLGYLLTAVHATAADTVTITGADPAVEVTERWRTTCNFAEVCGIRLQAHVATGGAVQLIAQGSLDGGATWAPLNAAAGGPVLSLVDAGEVVGQFVNLDAAFSAGDVVITVFAKSATADTAVIGNLHAMTSFRLTDGACPVYGDATCALPAAALTFVANDYADTAAYAAFATGASGFDGEYYSRLHYAAVADATIDPGVTYNNAHALLQPVAGAWAIEGYYESDPPHPDQTYLLRFRLDDIAVALDPEAAAAWPPLAVLRQFQTYENRYIVGFNASGKAVLRYSTNILSSNTYTDIEIGDAADFIGDTKEFLMRMKKTSTTTVQISLYLHAPCAEPVEYYQGTVAWAGGTNDWSQGDARFFSTANAIVTPSTANWTIFHEAWDTDPTVFGLTL